MRFCLPVFLVLFSVPLQAQSVPLTIQEALYGGGTSGVARTNEPVSVGIPLEDSASTGTTTVSTLTLSGASVGQFRALAHWPSGRIKWVLVDTLATLSAGAVHTSYTLTGGGSGNFGGSDLATDNGTTITIATGTSTFVIRKANFNGFHSAVVGSTTILGTGASTGLVVLGPVSANTSCGTCTTVYSSTNDASSTAAIEENGPVKAVIKATGSHKDGSGNSYMKFTVRMYFYKDKNYVKAVVSLRNADYSLAAGSFASAYKGHQGYEWRITPTLSGTATYQIAKHASVESGTLTAGTGDIYLYQGYSTKMEDGDWCAFGCVPYTTDTGYTVVKDASQIASGSSTQYPEGWGDIRGATNDAGVSIGVYQLASYWSKSLEFNDAGADTRIGIWPRQNSQPYYQAWPQWSTHNLYFNFHDAALSSPSDSFLTFQHYLVGRAARTHYNTTRVFPYPMANPTYEDAFFADTHSTAVPTNTFPFTAAGNAALTSSIPNEIVKIYRFRTWSSGGESNQTEFRWSYLQNFLQRGFTGQYLNASHFYRFETDDTFPHSDGFNWRDFPSDTDNWGRPENTTSANNSLAFRNWTDQEHGHWYGLTDYYFMSGDELVKETLLDGMADYYLDDTSYQAGVFGGLSNSRGTALAMLGYARFAAFLKSVGMTTEATDVLDNATTLFDEDIKGVLCTSSEASSQSCTPGAVDSETDPGTSRTRGMHYTGGYAAVWCGVSVTWRFHSNWVNAILQQALYEFSEQKGTAWSDYYLARDLMYGMSQGTRSEGYEIYGNGRWDQDGWKRAGIVIDQPGNCASPPPTQDENYWGVIALSTIWRQYFTTYITTGDTSWANELKINLLSLVNYTGVGTRDFYSWDLGNLLAILENPGTVTLNSTAITNLVDNGGGSYTVSWIVPTGAQSYRIKWGPKTIVELIGFNAATNAFIGNPTTTMNWFAATNATSIPAPNTPGTTQSITIATGTSSLTTANFSVKTYVDSAAQGSTPGGKMRVRIRGDGK